MTDPNCPNCQGWANELAEMRRHRGRLLALVQSVIMAVEQDADSLPRGWFSAALAARRDIIGE